MGNCASGRAKPPAFLADDNIEVLNVSSEFDSITSLIGNSFAGSADRDPELALNWALGPQLADRSDPKRAELLTFWVSINTQVHGSTGLVLGRRGTDGKLEAVIVARRMSSAEPRFEILREYTSAAQVIIPTYALGKVPKLGDTGSALQPPKKMQQRLDKMSALQKATHHENANFPHWYVAMMGVAPEAQGRGHAGKLMRAISKLADSERIPCYLETAGQRNATVYRRFGYAVTGTKDVSIEDDEPGSTPVEAYAMVRPAAVA